MECQLHVENVCWDVLGSLRRTVPVGDRRCGGGGLGALPARVDADLRAVGAATLLPRLLPTMSYYIEMHHRY